MSRPTKPTKAKDLCMGCRENFYNDNNPYGIKECWNFESAKVVTRWRIGWWTPQDSADNFTKVTTLSCRVDTGRFAYYDELPDRLVIKTGAKR